MGYVACIEAQVVLCTAFHFLKRALMKLRETGSYRRSRSSSEGQGATLERLPQLIFREAFRGNRGHRPLLPVPWAAHRTPAKRSPAALIPRDRDQRS